MNALLVCTLALRLAAGQENRPQRDGAGEPKTVLLEGIAVQAGEALVTLSELQRAKDNRLAKQPVASREEELRLTGELLRQLSDLRLEQQMGREMGIDATQIQRQVRYSLEEKRREIGLESYLEQLEGEGKDAFEAEADSEQDLFGWLWRRSKIGMPVAGRRPSLDRSPRPGELHAFFRENLEKLAPTQVQLQILVVSSAAAGGPELARESCAEARERVLEGEDMGDLVEELGVELRETRGLLQLVPAPALRDPAMRAFAEQAAIGELSEVLALQNPRTGQPDPEVGFQLACLRDRQETPEPDFEDPRLQSDLRMYFQNMRAEVILTRERALLRRDSYTWINPRLGGPPASSSTPPAR